MDAPEGWQRNESALCNLYEFFDQTNLIPEFLKSWKKYIEEHGNNYFSQIKAEKDPFKLANAVRQICALKSKASSVVEKCFASSQATAAAQKVAFETFLNVEGR